MFAKKENSKNQLETNKLVTYSGLVGMGKN